MLRFENLVLEQPGFRLAADCALPQGALVAVIGPSGAGKSSLLAAIGGFYAPARGRITWAGRDLAPLPPSRRPVATIFQDNNLFPHLTAFQNAALGLTPKARLSADQRAQVTEALAKVGLEGLAERRPAALSGGQQSRVALARALLQDRPILLLDEAFSALGPALKSEMIDLARDLSRQAGRTMLMVTHDPEDARRLGGLALLVAEGQVHAPREAAELLDDPPPALRDYLG